MSICRFCEQEFANAQAVRAHLKGCVAYRNRQKPDTAPPGLREEPLGSASLLGSASREGSVGTDAAFDPVRQLEQRLAAEQLRLRLRELEEVHHDLDLREQAREQERLRESKQQAEAVRKVDREREAERARLEAVLQERRQKQDAQQRLQARRRETIQAVKHEVIASWTQRFSASDELKAQILEEIELTLVRLTVDELPREELIQIAQAVRDRLYARAVEAQTNALRLAQKRQSLADHDLEYAKRELREVEGLDLSERWSIETRVKEELAQVSGGETRAEIEDWVDEILEREGIEYDDQ